MLSFLSFLPTILLGVFFGLQPLEEAIYASKAANPNKPLLIVVSGDGCAPCKILKETVIAPMVKSGELDEFSVGVADIRKDSQSRLKILTWDHKANRQVNMIPQTVLLFQKDGQWYMYRENGLISKNQVLKMIEAYKNYVK